MRGVLPSQGCLVVPRHEISFSDESGPVATRMGVQGAKPLARVWAQSLQLDGGSCGLWPQGLRMVWGAEPPSKQTKTKPLIFACY